MHEIIAFLKKIVPRDRDDITTCYIFRSGSIYASNSMTGMHGGVSLDTPAEFNVPAKEFDTALSRMKAVQSLAFDGDSLMLKGDRLKVSIRCKLDEPPEIPALPENWQRFPAETIAALKLAKNFVGEQSWQASIRLMDERVAAFTGKSGIEITVPHLIIGSSLLTIECANFLIDQDAPDEYSAASNCIFFRWSNGRWLKSQLVDAQMPNLTPVFGKAGTDAPTPITSDWRTAFDDASTLSNGNIIITPLAIQSELGAASSSVSIETKGVMDDHQSCWSADVLAPIIANATQWNPGAYPNPSLFIGPNFRGVVIGLNKR
jgi:hypothetical protein